MPKFTLTDKEKVNLELYINFVTHNSNPCESCDWRSKMECCGCPSGNEYQKKLKKYDVADLLNYKEIKEYVISSIKLNKYRAQVQSLTNDIRNLEKKIDEIMDSADLIKESEKTNTEKLIRFICPNKRCPGEFSASRSECVKFNDMDGTDVYAKACPLCRCLCKVPIDD